MGTRTDAPASRVRASKARVAVALVTGTAPVAVAVAATPAGAHTGLPAGGLVDGIVHPVVGTDHLVAMLAVGVLAATAAERVAWWVPVGFVAGMAAGGLVGMRTGPVAVIETGIVASVVVLGGLIAVIRRTDGWWLPPVAATVGALHGHAHGAELPDGAAPVAYLVGFVAATAALHVAGTGVGLLVRRRAPARLAAGAIVSAAGAALVTGTLG